MALISITRLRVRAFRYMPGFLILTVRSALQVKRSDGNLGMDLLRDAKRTFWTRTAWRDEPAMRAFMMAMPHRRAMAKLIDWCDEASLVHWTQETDELPNWHEAHRQMVEKGRRSKVRHPSPAHDAYEIARPNVGAGG
jgi:hypothetical protein